MNTHIRCFFLFLSASGVAACAAPATAQEPGWTLRAYGGYSALSDTDGDAGGLDTGNGKAEVSVDGGFVTGLGLGYRYNAHWAVELAWEYRSNDSETTLDGGRRFPDGNYASNTVYLNGFYYTGRRGAWDPYVGVGVGWLQEVDIDLEDADGELSYSGDGEVGYQLLAVTDYHFNDRWSANAEVRYGAFGSLDLEAEGGAPGQLGGLDYEAATVALGVRYAF